MSDKKAEIKRDNTMQVTAKEGIKLLKDAGEHTLLEMQGLHEIVEEPDENTEGTSDPGKPRLQRLSTMAVTAKEGEQFLEEQKKKVKLGQPKPKLSKFTTMMKTKEEGEAFLAAKDDTKNKNQLEKNNEEPALKKLKLNNEKADNKKPTAKRISYLARTAKEGEELLKELGHRDDNPDSERRRTRSQTRGVPPPPPPPEKKNKKKDETNNGGTRGRKGRPRLDKNKEKVVDAKNVVDTKNEKKEREENAAGNTEDNNTETENDTTTAPAAATATTTTTPGVNDSKEGAEKDTSDTSTVKTKEEETPKAVAATI